MEKRDFCIEFMKGTCELKINCKYAHILVPDPEVFIKTYENRKLNTNNNNNDDNQEVKKYTLMGAGSSNEKWVTDCDICKKGIIVSTIHEKGSIETLYCKDCLFKLQNGKGDGFRG